MSKYNPKEWNYKLAELIGYEYREDNIMVSMKDDDEPVTVISKVKIVTDEYGEGEYRYKYLGRVEPEDPSKWDQKKLEMWDWTIWWASENKGNFMYLHDWNPEEDWNQLMEVVAELGMVRIASDQKRAYEDVCMAIELKER